MIFIGYKPGPWIFQIWIRIHGTFRFGSGSRELEDLWNFERVKEKKSEKERVKEKERKRKNERERVKEKE